MAFAPAAVVGLTSMLFTLVSCGSNAATVRGTFTIPKEGSSVSEVSALSIWNGRVYGLSDNSTIYEFGLELDINGSLSSVQLTRSVALAGGHDTEGLVVFAAGAGGEGGDGRLVAYVSTEDDLRISLYDVEDGSLVSESANDWVVPDVLTSHVQSNKGFESLASSPHYRTVVTGNEAALSVDDDDVVRLLEYRVGTAGLPITTAAYRLHDSTYGLVEVVALDDTGLRGGRVLTLERNYVDGSNNILLFLVETDGATNVSSCSALSSQSECSNYRPVSKRLLFSMADLDVSVDNYEAVTIIPQPLVTGTNTQPSLMFPGEVALLMVNDNNDNAQQLGTQFLLATTDIWLYSDIDLLIVTDIHSWVSSHRHADHTPHLDADYGHLLSFVQHVETNSHLAHGSTQSPLLVNNGDIVEGTGLSDVTPIHGLNVLPLLELMPFDAINIGNHELYRNSTIHNIGRTSGFVEHFSQQYLTSNVRWTSNGQHIGRTHTTILTGDHNVVVMGFLFNFEGACDEVSVQVVEEAVQESWFEAAVGVDSGVEAAVILGHMGFDWAEVYTILSRIRQIRGPLFPVVFCTGHTHVRQHKVLDANAVSFEAGHYFDTIGHLNIQLPLNNATNGSAHFSYRFVDANVATLAATVGVDEAEFDTTEGLAVRQRIYAAREELGLDEVIGCSPGHYVPDSETTFDLMMNHVLPSSLPWTEATVGVCSTGGLRYDLFEGPITVDDIVTLSPFGNTYLSAKVPRSVIPAVLTVLSSQEFAHSTIPPESAGTVSKLVIQNFDQPVVEAALVDAGVAPPAFTLMDTQLDSTTVWTHFIGTFWPCGTAETPTPTALPSNGKGGHTKLEETIGVIALLGLFGAVVVYGMRRRKSGKPELGERTRVVRSVDMNRSYSYGGGGDLGDGNPGSSRSSSSATAATGSSAIRDIPDDVPMLS